MSNFELIDDYRKHFSIFGPFIGQSLKSCAHDRCFFNGVPDHEDDGSLEFQFESGDLFTLQIANDGDSVLATRCALTIQESFSPDENSRYEWRRIQLSDTEPWSTLCGRALTYVEAKVWQWKVNGEPCQCLAAWHVWFGAEFVSRTGARK